MIIKTYRQKEAGFHGQDPESWAKNWADADFLVGALASEGNHLSFFFNEALRAKARSFHSIVGGISPKRKTS
jgi:hypothetical protein